MEEDLKKILELNKELLDDLERWVKDIADQYQQNVIVKDFERKYPTGFIKDLSKFTQDIIGQCARVGDHKMAAITIGKGSYLEEFYIVPIANNECYAGFTHSRHLTLYNSIDEMHLWFIGQLEKSLSIELKH